MASLPYTEGRKPARVLSGQGDQQILSFCAQVFNARLIYVQLLSIGQLSCQLTAVVGHFPVIVRDFCF